MQEREEKVSGFTLVELMIVIAIIAILVGIAIPLYLKYQRKAKIATYALPVVRGCAMDLATFCMKNPGTVISATGNSSVSNCISPVITPLGNATLTIYGGQCKPSGALNGTIVKGDLGTVNEYSAKCRFDADGNIQCTIESS
ncbi:MAG: prepilin-type N-terminal cleavage/methylation domain-containing protein [Caldimicrobium sp.]